jgi:carbamate kinase
MRIVVALGGNALLRRGEPLEATQQRENVELAARSIAAIARGNELVITHGNGPQVGLLALQSEAYQAVHPYPLDVLGAESAGMIGYMLEQALGNELPEREIVTVLTEVIVDPEDPAFGHPTKPVGPVYSEESARALATQQGWFVAQDGAGYRRVVASPEPREIVQADTIKKLVDWGVMVICSGGGGIPTVLDCKSGRRVGVEAVIDKDLSAALLALEVRAEFLMLLTDVEAVQADWRTPDARPLQFATPSELRALSFAAGSMAPKIEAACRFVEATGHQAAIGSLSRAGDILDGRSGTRIASHPGSSVLAATSTRRAR